MFERSHAVSAYRFGGFVLEPLQQRLSDAGRRPVPLTPKAFDTLLCLVERSGELVSKRELLERIWPDVVVEEAILARNVADLRKALGDDAAVPRYIETLPKRGYRFIAMVTVDSEGGALQPAAPAATTGVRPVDTLQLVASAPARRAADAIIEAPELLRNRGHRTLRAWLLVALALAAAVAFLWYMGRG